MNAIWFRERNAANRAAMESVVDKSGFHLRGEVQQAVVRSLNPDDMRLLRRL